ncbi:MAG: nitroreductase family protein, partial [Anaerolineae bacterium]
FERSTERYQERGRVRYVPMDLGHAAENLTLQAVALGLVSVSVGAFDDDAVRQVLVLPAREEPMYLIPVGHPA